MRFLFLVFLLSPLNSYAVVEIWLPKFSHSKCVDYFRYLRMDPLTKDWDEARELPPQYPGAYGHAKMVEAQWQFIKPEYIKLLTQKMGMTSEQAEAWCKHSEELDKKIPYGHVGYMVSRNKEGDLDAWMSFVSNIPIHEMDLTLKRCSGKKCGVSGVIPIEVENPDVIPFLEKKYPARIMFTRHSSNPNFHEVRATEMADFLKVLTASIWTRETDPVIIGDCPKARLDFYNGFGFEPIETPGFNAGADRFLIAAKVSEVRKIAQVADYFGHAPFADSIQIAAPNFTEAGLKEGLVKVDHYMSYEVHENIRGRAQHLADMIKANYLRGLGKYDEALKTVARVERRWGEHPHVESLKFSLEVLSRKNNLENALKFVRSSENSSANKIMAMHEKRTTTIDVPFSDAKYWEAWLLLEAGRLEEAKKLIRANFFKLHKDAFDINTNGTYQKDPSIEQLNFDLKVPPFGLSPAFRKLRAEKLLKLEKKEEAKKEFAIAELLEKAMPY